MWVGYQILPDFAQLDVNTSDLQYDIGETITASMLLVSTGLPRFLAVCRSSTLTHLGVAIFKGQAFSHKEKGGVALRGCVPTYYIENSVSILFPHCYLSGLSC